jgi:hypothetical protein
MMLHHTMACLIIIWHGCGQPFPAVSCATDHASVCATYCCARYDRLDQNWDQTAFIQVMNSLLPKETLVMIVFFILLLLVIDLVQFQCYQIASNLLFYPLPSVMVPPYLFLVSVMLNFLPLQNLYFFMMFLLHPLSLET